MSGFPSTYSPKSSPRGARSPVVSRQDSTGTLKTTISLGKNPSIVHSGPFYLMKEPPCECCADESVPSSVRRGVSFFSSFPSLSIQTLATSTANPSPRQCDGACTDRFASNSYSDILATQVPSLSCKRSDRHPWLLHTRVKICIYDMSVCHCTQQFFFMILLCFF